MLSTTKRVRQIRKKKFTIMILEPDHKALVIYIATLNISSNIGDEVHPSKSAQITHLKVDKTLTKVFNNYANFADVFSPKLAIKLLKYTNINNHAIELIDY